MKGKRTLKRFLAVVMAVVFTVTGITFTPESVKAADPVYNTWTTIGTNGWQYYVKGSGSSYSGGTSFSDPIEFYKGSYEGQSGNLQFKTPTTSVIANHIYSVTLTGTATNRVGSVSVTVYVNGSNVYSESKELPTSGQTWTTTYTPEASGTMYVSISSGWTNIGTYTYAVSNTDTGETVTPSVNPVKPATVDASWHQTVDTSETDNGVWWYYINNNEWSNREVKYEDADDFTGFKIYHKNYSATHSFYATNNLKSAYSLTAGNTYTVTVTLKGTNKSSSAYDISLNAKTAPNSETRTAVGNSVSLAGDNTEHTVQLTGNVDVTNNDLCLELDFGNNVQQSDVEVYAINFAAEQAPDLTDVIAHTPDVSSTSSSDWTQKYGGNGATIANTIDSSGRTYYIATDFMYPNGTYNTFFTTDSVYGIYDSGTTVPWSGGNGNVTGDKYGFSTGNITSKIASVWVNGTKISSNDWYHQTDNKDVMIIATSVFTMAANESEKIFYVSVRKANGTDYSWPIKIVKEGTTTTAAPTTTTTEAPTTTEPQDGYNTCITLADSGNLQDIGNNWQYQVSSSAGYRYGTYDGVTYLAEMKNRYSNSNTMYLYTPSGFKTLTNGTEYNVEITFHSTGTVPVNMTSYYSSAMPNVLLGSINSGNTTLRTTFTAADNFNGRYQIILTGVPAGVEVGITNLSITEATSSPVDPVSGSVASGSANAINATFTEGTSIPSGQKYGLFVDGSSTPTGSLIASVGDSETINQTISGLTAGSHTVTVKATLDDGTTWSTGRSLGSATAYDPNPVAPASVIAADSDTQGEALDVTINASASAVAGQTYNVYLDNDTTPIATGVAAGTYTYDVGDLTSHTIKVSGYLATAATTESGKTSSNSVASTWKKAQDNTWSTAIDGWQFQLYGAYGSSQAMDYKGTTGSDNMQVRVDASSGDATGGHYAIQMKKALSDLYSGLTPGVTYTMTMTADSSVNDGGVYVQGIGNNEEFDISNSVLTIEKSVTIPASPSGDMMILLDGLTAGTVLSNFDVTFTPTTVPVVNPATVTGAATSNNDEIEVSWTAGSGALSTTVYDIYLDDDASPRATNVSISGSPVTISNLPASYRGTGHTVKVVPKVTEGGTTYTNTGTTSSSFMIKGPIAIDTFHDGVTATTISIYWNDPANMCTGQQYNVYVDGVKTADSPMSAPTSSSPYVIENLTTDQVYTVMVKAVYNSEESAGVSKAITPKSVDPSWTATAASGYTWYQGANRLAPNGLATYDSPNLYYKLGDADGEDSAWMSFKNINSEATKLHLISTALMGRVDSTANYTITLTFNSDVADSTGGLWKYGLDNANTYRALTPASARTIAVGTNTYTETFSHTIAANNSYKQPLNGFFEIEIPSGATIEITSFTITTDDSLNTYKNMVQDRTWKQTVPSSSGTAKWYYNAYESSWNNSAIAYRNAENYGETSTDAGDGFYFYSPNYITNTTYISTGDLTSEFNLEDGRKYDVSLTMVGSNNSSYGQTFDLQSKATYDASGSTQINAQTFTANCVDESHTFTGTVWGSSSGVCLQIKTQGSMQAGEYRIKSLSITPSNTGKHAVGDGDWHQTQVDASSANGLWYYKLPASTSSTHYSAVYSGSGADSSGTYTGLAVTNESSANTQMFWATQNLKTKYSLDAGKAYTATVTLNVNNRTDSGTGVSLNRKTAANSDDRTNIVTTQTIAAETDNQTITLSAPVTIESSALCLELAFGTARDLDFTVTNITFTPISGKAMIPDATWRQTEATSSSAGGLWWYYVGTPSGAETVVYTGAEGYSAFNYHAVSSNVGTVHVATQITQDSNGDPIEAGKRYVATVGITATNNSASAKTIDLCRKDNYPYQGLAYYLTETSIAAGASGATSTMTANVDTESSIVSLQLSTTSLTDLDVTVTSVVLTPVEGRTATVDGNWHQTALNDGTVSGLWWYKFSESGNGSGIYKDASASQYEDFTFATDDEIVGTGKDIYLATGNLKTMYGLETGKSYQAIVTLSVKNYQNDNCVVGLNHKTATTSETRTQISDHMIPIAADPNPSSPTPQTIEIVGAAVEVTANDNFVLELQLGDDDNSINKMEIEVTSIQFYTAATADGDWHNTGGEWWYKTSYDSGQSSAPKNRYDGEENLEGFHWVNAQWYHGGTRIATNDLTDEYNLEEGYTYTVKVVARGTRTHSDDANPVNFALNVKSQPNTDTTVVDHIGGTQELHYGDVNKQLTFTGDITVGSDPICLEIQTWEWMFISDFSIESIQFEKCKIPNTMVYTAANNGGNDLINGATYNMTFKYKTNRAGDMNYKAEGYMNDFDDETATYTDYTTFNTITYQFVYDSSQTVANKYFIADYTDFADGYRVKDLTFEITGGVMPGVGIVGTRISRTQGMVRWSDPVGATQFYNVYINNSSTPTLTNVRAGTHTLNGIPDTAANDYTVSVKAVNGAQESSAISTTINDWIVGTSDDTWHDVDGYGYKFQTDWPGEYSFTYDGNPFTIKDTRGSYPEWGNYEVGSAAKTVEAGQQYAYSITVEREKTDAIAVRLDGGTFDGGTPANQTPSEAGEDITFTGTFTATSNTVRLYTNYSWPGNDEKISIKSLSIMIPNQVELRNTGSAVEVDLTAIEGLSTSYTLSYESNYTAINNEAVSAADVSAHKHTLASMPDNQTKVYVKDGSGNVKGVALAQADLTIDSVTVNKRSEKYGGVQYPIHTNTNNCVEILVKNVGTAKANIVHGPGAYQDLGVKASEGNWYNTDWAFNPYAVVLDPNGTYLFTVNGWRPVDITEYTLTCEVNHENWIPESDYSNNTTYPKFTTTAQLEDSTAVLGFQLNTDTSTYKGPSYFNPSFRTVCRALKTVEVNGVMKNVTGYGFVFAKTNDAGMTNLKNEMTVANAKTFTKKDGTVETHDNGNDYIKALEAKEEVNYDEYTTHGSTYTKDNSYFFALTFQDLYYTTTSLETQYTFRSYLTYTDDSGQTQYVYPNDIYSTSLYEIAEDLYKFKKMKTEDAHNFLYDYILNIISMRDNYSDIMKATLKTLGVTSSNRNTNPYKDYYKMANMNYKDMYYYAMCTNGYGYKSTNKVYDETAPPYTDDKLVQRAVAPYAHDYVYQSKQLDESTYSNAQFLGLLNTATATDYTNFPDWARGCVGKTVNGIDLTQFKGMYKKVAYDWDSNLDKDYGKSE